MYRATMSLLVGVSLTMLGPQAVHARGCGGAHASGGYHGSGPAGGHYSGGYSAGSHYASGPQGSEAMRGGASYHSYQGPHGGSVEHGTAAVQGAAAGPGGAAAGGRAVSGTEVTTPKGNTYTHESSAGRGAAVGPQGAAAGHYGQTSSSYQGAAGGYYSHGAAGYGAAHTALPTDAGYGAAAARTGSAGYAGYAGYHQTEAANANLYAARGAAVRNSYNNYGMYGAAWHTANPGAWAATGWAAGHAWTPATWPAVGASLGWGAGVQPVAYDYGNNVTYQNNQVYYGNEPVASAEEYYQQAATVAQSAPPAAPADEWLPLGVFALVQKEQSEPHYVMHLAMNKAGAIAGNYTDMVGETNVPIQGAVDKKTQRAAWTVGKNKTTVCETGIYNLTQDEVPVLIHVGKDKTQQWLLVRLKQPPQQGP